MMKIKDFFIRRKETADTIKKLLRPAFLECKKEHKDSLPDYYEIFKHEPNALHLAIQYSEKCLEHLLSGPFGGKMVKYLQDGDAAKSSPLHLAAANITPNCAKKLLGRINVNVGLNSTDCNGNTPLHVVCQKGENVC